MKTITGLTKLPAYLQNSTEAQVADFQHRMDDILSTIADRLALDTADEAALADVALQLGKWYNYRHERNLRLKVLELKGAVPPSHVSTIAHLLMP